jgi:HPt (histidine-containing phosphotransfer) domain-containing protein
VEKGINRYAGEKIYFKVLRAYASDIRALLATVMEPVAERLADYKITVHGIKGTSYSIHADEVGRMAEALENAAASGDFGFVEEHNPAFVAAAGGLLDRLDAFIKALETGEIRPVKGKPDAGLLEKLLSACRNFDLDEAEDVMAEIERFVYNADDGLTEWLRINIAETNLFDVEQRLMDMGV